jgi:CheY-like chemotaxis protein
MTNPLVLIADDETHILNVVSLKLCTGGYRVLTARTGREALELARQHRPDLLITDFHMPELSGLELCRAMRQGPQAQKIPTILLTARGYTLEPADTRDLGIVGMFSKPFSPRKLLASVIDVLEERSRLIA